MAEPEVSEEALISIDEPSDEPKAEEPTSPQSSSSPGPEPLTTVPSPSPPQNDNHDMHSVIGIIRDQELGKATLALPIPIAMALLTSGKQNLGQPEMSLILIALSVGCAAIWNGILLRDTFPWPAQVLESVGIALVFITFHGLVAFLLPVEFVYVPAVCMGLTLLPFIIAATKLKAQPGPR